MCIITDERLLNVAEEALALGLFLQQQQKCIDSVFLHLFFVAFVAVDVCCYNDDEMAHVQQTSKHERPYDYTGARNYHALNRIIGAYN